MHGVGFRDAGQVALIFRIHHAFFGFAQVRHFVMSRSFPCRDWDLGIPGLEDEQVRAGRKDTLGDFGNGSAPTGAERPHTCAHRATCSPRSPPPNRHHWSFHYLKQRRSKPRIRTCLRIQFARDSEQISGKKLAELTCQEHQPQLKKMFCHPK